MLSMQNFIQCCAAFAHTRMLSVDIDLMYLFLDELVTSELEKISDLFK